MEGYWSFDDNHIGMVKMNGSCLSTRSIPRPTHLPLSNWYSHASKVCNALNLRKQVMKQETVYYTVGDIARHYELTFLVLKDQKLTGQELAQKCALDFYSDHCGHVHVWPLVFRIYDSENGSLRCSANVYVENTTTFRATDIAISEN